jgi:fructose-specific phosphotransferase system IIC component
MSKRYGFEAEVAEKYGGKAASIMKACQYVFAAIPLATVLDKRVLIIHAVSNSVQGFRW